VAGGLLATGPLFSNGGWTGLATCLGIVVVMAVASFFWSRRHALGRVVPDVLLATTVACVLSIALVPLISEISEAIRKGHWIWKSTNPFALGAGVFFSRIWVFYGCALVGALIGWMITVAIGQDSRSKALKHYATMVTTKPHRAVRR
jgi:hypothetical protein